MGDARSRPRKKPDLLPIELYAMRVPDIRAGPAQILGILAGAAAEFRQRIGDILVILGQMGMQHHALVARQKRGIAHQITADREGRTGRKTHPHHGPRRGVMEAVHHADAILQNRGLALDQTVGGQAAVAFTNAHGAARRVETQAHLLRRGDGVIKPRPVWKEVEMI